MKKRENRTFYDYLFKKSLNAVIDRWKKALPEKRTDEDLAEELGIAAMTIRSWRMETSDRRPNAKTRKKLIDIAIEQNQYFEAEVLESEDMRSPGDESSTSSLKRIEAMRERYGMNTRIKVKELPDVDMFNLFKKKGDFEKEFNPFSVTKRELWDRCEQHWIESVFQRTFSTMDYERDPYLKKLPEGSKYYYEREGRYYLLGNRDLVKLKQIEDDLKKYFAFLLYEKREEDNQVIDFLWRLSNKYPHFTDASDYYDPDDYRPLIPTEEDYKKAEELSKEIGHPVILEPYYPEKPTDEEIEKMREAWADKMRIDSILIDLENGGDMWKGEYKKMLEQEAKEDGKH